MSASNRCVRPVHALSLTYSMVSLPDTMPLMPPLLRMGLNVYKQLRIFRFFLCALSRSPWVCSRHRFLATPPHHTGRITAPSFSP